MEILSRIGAREHLGQDKHLGPGRSRLADHGGGLLHGGLIVGLCPQLADTQTEFLSVHGTHPFRKTGGKNIAFLPQQEGNALFYRFQMRSAYSRTARSAAKKPLSAMFTSDRRARSLSSEMRV